MAFHRQSIDDNDWWRWKVTQDEEGDLAWVLGKRLKEGFASQRSARHEKNHTR